MRTLNLNLIVLVTALAIIFSPATARAELPEFQPIVPLPQVDYESTTFGKYVAEIYNLAVSIGAILAVLMMIWGGFAYMTSDVVKAKVDGLSRIRNALIGLVLLIASYLILYIINPCIVQITVFTEQNGGCSPVERGVTQVGPVTVDSITNQVQIGNNLTYDAETGRMTFTQNGVTVRSDGLVGLPNGLQMGPPGSTACGNPTQICIGPNNAAVPMPANNQCPADKPTHREMCLNR